MGQGPEMADQGREMALEMVREPTRARRTRQAQGFSRATWSRMPEGAAATEWARGSQIPPREQAMANRRARALPWAAPEVRRWQERELEPAALRVRVRAPELRAASQAKGMAMKLRERKRELAGFEAGRDESRVSEKHRC